MAAPSTIPGRRNVKADIADKPTDPLSLSSQNWKDTLPDGRMGALAPEQIEPLGIIPGVTDESQYIQAQLIAAAARGKAVVQLDNRPYGISPGIIWIPTHITLCFAGSAATGRQVVDYSVIYGGTGQSGVSGNSGGVFVMLNGQGASDTDPAYINFAGPHSALKSAAFFDPDNPSTLTTPVAKPFAVRTGIYGVTLENIELINTYRGIDVHNSGRCIVKNVFGNPLSLGIRLDMCYDVPRLIDCHFVDSFVNSTALNGWFHNNAKAYQMLDNDEVYADRLFSYGYKIGLELAASPVSGRGGTGQAPHGTYGVIANSGFDGAQTCILDSCTQPVGSMKITNVSCATVNYEPVGSVGYHAAPGKTGVTNLYECSFWGTAEFCAWIEGGTIRMIAPKFIQGASLGLYLSTGPSNVEVVYPEFLSRFPNFEIDIETSASTSTGRVVGARFAPSIFVPLRVKNFAPNVLVNADNRIDLIGFGVNQPKVVWKNTDAPANSQKLQAYVTATGDLQVDALTDDEAAGVRLLLLRHNGTLSIKAPTSPTGLLGGDLWNNNGVVNIINGTS